MQTQRRRRGEKAIKDRDRGLDLGPKPRTVQSHQRLKEAEQESPMLVLKGLVDLHRTVQLQLLQCYWLGHRLGLL